MGIFAVAACMFGISSFNKHCTILHVNTNKKISAIISAEDEYIDDFIAEIFNSIWYRIDVSAPINNTDIYGYFCCGSWPKGNNSILKTNDDTIRTEYVQIVYEYKEIAMWIV